jgi:hypothetical protein
MDWHVLLSTSIRYYIGSMFFVGHISIAFILSYFVITRFQVQNISLSLILFLSILPDVDIIFRFLAADIGHRSITHSIIVFTIVSFVFLLKYRRCSIIIIIYSIAYLSHFATGDLIVGTLNLLYPFGTFYLSGGIDFKTFEHILVEGLVLAIMTIIVIIRCLCDRKRKLTFPFEYSKKLDPIFYPIVISAIIVSPVFLLDESQRELFDFPNSFFSLFKFHYNLNTILILTLHVFSMAIVIFLWIITRRTYISSISNQNRSNNIVNTTN